MNSKQNPPQDSHEAYGKNASRGPGYVLRAAREQARLTCSDVALHLHLRNSVIEGIEEDDYSKMPDFVFVRGYLRAYANLLELPADEVIKIFNDLKLPEPNSDRPRAQFKQPGPQRRHGMFRMMSYGVVLGLVIIAALWWNSQRTLHQEGYTLSSPTQPTQEQTLAPDGLEAMLESSPTAPLLFDEATVDAVLAGPLTGFFPHEPTDSDS